MPKADEKLTKHTLNLYEGDYETLRTWYPEIGAGVIIRNIVRKYINNIKAGSEKQVNVDVDL